MFKALKPKTPSQRHRVLIKRQTLSKIKHFPKLIKGFSRSFGKNNQGKITVRHRGGGHKRLYRNISFVRENVEGEVVSIEYDPNRSCNIAALKGKTRETYILAPEGLTVGSYVSSGPNAKISAGNALPLNNIPVGSYIHNISLQPNSKGKLIRSAGTSGQLLQKTLNNRGKVRLASGQQYSVPLNVYATLGSLSNFENKNKKLGKAGCSRWLNKRPSVRGVAKNPVDHPHGGGEGKTSGGRPSVSFTGRITKGKPTRKKNKKSNV
jgi:large subunit ribosomal protein L2